MAALLLLFEYGENYFTASDLPVLGIAIVVNLFFVGLMLWNAKLFDVYEDKLVIKYPKILLIKPSVIDFSLVKSMTFKYNKGGAPHVMTVVYERKSVRYRFSTVFGMDLDKIFDLLMVRGIKIKLEGFTYKGLGNKLEKPWRFN